MSFLQESETCEKDGALEEEATDSCLLSHNGGKKRPRRPLINDGSGKRGLLDPLLCANVRRDSQTRENGILWLEIGPATMLTRPGKLLSTGVPLVGPRLFYNGLIISPDGDGFDAGSYSVLNDIVPWQFGQVKYSSAGIVTRNAREVAAVVYHGGASL